MKTSLQILQYFALAMTLVFDIALIAFVELYPASAQQEPCQEPLRNSAWPIFRKGDLVFTKFDSTVPDDLRLQIQRGIESWHNSDAKRCSGVNFSLNDPDLIEPNRPEPTYVLYRFAPLYNNDGSINTSTAARFTTNHLREDGTIFMATVTFNSAARADPSDPNSGPFYDPNAPTLPGNMSNGYDTIFQKLTAHELGHGFRLFDLFFGSDKASIMLNVVTDCPNDNCGHLPLGVTRCDSAAVCKVYCPDADGDTVTTCDGDCDDNDPTITYECYYVEPPPPSPDPQPCYWTYNCYDWYDCSDGCRYMYTECYEHERHCN